MTERLLPSAQCVICAKIFSDPRVLSCGHTFCLGCLEALMLQSEDHILRCPECRTRETNFSRVNRLPKNFQLQRLLDELLQDQVNARAAPSIPTCRQLLSVTNKYDELFHGAVIAKNCAGVWTRTAIDKQLQGKVVALYFAAYWCPGCRDFTIILKNFYEVLELLQQFEIVFVPLDDEQNVIETHMKPLQGNWCMLEPQKEAIDQLVQQYDVNRIPCLCVIKPDGTVVDKKARFAVEKIATKKSDKGPLELLDQWVAACSEAPQTT